MEDTEGRLVKMEGRVSGSQPISVRWFRGGSEILSSDQYDVSFKSNVSVLCIKSSRVTDSGSYQCRASNEAGESCCDVTVGIRGGSAGTPVTLREAALQIFSLSLLLCASLKAC